LTQGRDTRENTIRVLDEIEKTIQHSKDITTSIQSFVQDRRLQTTTVAVDDLLAQAFMLASPLARDHGAQLVFPQEGSELDVQADRVQTTHVILNLIVNAIEACRDAERDEPRIEVRTEPRGNDLLAVLVSDNGPGLPEARQKELFQEFQSDKIGGMGIGLTISRDICKAQQGELTASNNSDGSGCTFCFTLPLPGGNQNDTGEMDPIRFP
jgi:C4-dicarboxylate-specific signal transduction histidine kinase